MIGIKPKPKIVDITRKVGTAETLTESCIHCSITEKDLYLYYFLQQHPGRTLVFCNSIDCVRRYETRPPITMVIGGNVTTLCRSCIFCK